LEITVINARFLKPVDRVTLDWAVQQHSALLTVEEGTVINGFGASIARMIGDVPDNGVSVEVMGVPDRIIEHATRSEQLAEVGLTPADIAARARVLASRIGMVAARETA
jgi:1-deoxy-D-xylulose-5-phosphate synthase